jgi:hypothetical protein
MEFKFLRAIWERRMKIKCEDEILLSPEKVFPWIAEPEKAMKWQKNVKGGKIIIDNPEVIGTTFEEILEEDGKCHKIINRGKYPLEIPNECFEYRHG